MITNFLKKYLPPGTVEKATETVILYFHHPKFKIGSILVLHALKSSTVDAYLEVFNENITFLKMASL
jgi:hypothetical protein